MTINTSKQAIKKACAQTTNTVGSCQANVRAWFNSPSAGDQDHDGDADAVDGWESEPVKYRVTSRDPDLVGVPMSFHGGSHGYGHRTLLMNKGRIRSTDMLNNRYSPGHTSTVSAATTSEAIAIVEHEMGVIYSGVSKTIDGYMIPNFASKPAVKKTSRGAKVDQAIKDATALVRDLKNAARDAKSDARTKHLNLAAKQAASALANLKKVPFIK